jgi:hemerythrin HHE cation binding domain-containing protein
MTEIDKLRGEHALLVKIVARLEHLIGQPKPPPQLHLFALRYELSSTLIGHLKDQDWVVYPRLLASCDGHVAETARLIIEEMGGLAEAYVEHCEKWSAGAIAADWEGYCSDSRSFLKALTNRIARETRELYPLLERLDRAA